MRAKGPVPSVPVTKGPDGLVYRGVGAKFAFACWPGPKDFEVPLKVARWNPKGDNRHAWGRPPWRWQAQIVVTRRLRPGPPSPSCVRGLDRGLDPPEGAVVPGPGQGQDQNQDQGQG